MITKTYTPNDGQARTITGKQFGDEFRIYRVYGDITKADALAEIAQNVANDFDCTKVTFKM